jgi:hypothetical protein
MGRPNLRTRARADCAGLFDRFDCLLFAESEQR